MTVPPWAQGHLPNSNDYERSEKHVLWFFLISGICFTILTYDRNAEAHLNLNRLTQCCISCSATSWACSSFLLLLILLLLLFLLLLFFLLPFCWHCATLPWHSEWFCPITRNEAKFRFGSSSADSDLCFLRCLFPFPSSPLSGSGPALLHPSSQLQNWKCKQREIATVAAALSLVAGSVIGAGAAVKAEEEAATVAASEATAEAPVG